MLSNSLIALLEKKRSSLSKIENEILDYIFLHLSDIGTKRFMKYLMIYLSQLLLSPERLNI